jgi:hypothetical protein
MPVSDDLELQLDARRIGALLRDVQGNVALVREFDRVADQSSR